MTYYINEAIIERHAFTLIYLKDNKYQGLAVFNF